ncbi:hypothetical protein SMSP2_02237 [Limihaloglobus sulfuriphilus]|uniref:FG-GAP repeat n=1 Tax=Limihaloglobus sulfuriphilus TaxID=1851148 RepID=A0A1Q2MH50_9BACT|nr:FG-GAP-like repeat-containing protein [Limihaloglobus sulfuriphilus]AQQ71858.1 hypothetical protein SMSP2_02237 [Limihaloglobus sulfuriphilus]
MKIFQKSLIYLYVLLSLWAINASGEVLFYNSFEDDGFRADYAGGSAAAVFHDSLSPVTGKSGRGLWCRPNEYIRYETDENISFNLATVCMWVKPNYNPGKNREQFGPEVQCLFSIRIRTGDMIELRLRNDKTPPGLWLMTGSKEGGRSNINVPIEDWKADQWHRVCMSWDREKSMLALKADNSEWAVIEDASIPQLPEAMAYDMYLGTNSNQTALMRMEHFDGVIDEVVITDTWLDDDPSQPPAQKSRALPENFNTTPRHIGKNRYRVNIHVEPVNDKWDRLPVKAEIEFTQEWMDLTPAQKRKALNSFRLLRYDPQSGEPVVYDKSQSGENRFFIPFQIDDSLFYSPSAVLRFTHQGSREAGYSFYYDTAKGYRQPYPLEIPMVGNGDRLRIGRKDTTGMLCSGISGVFDVFDIDGDGNLDLWMNSGTLKTRACTELQVGHYYFENISDELNKKDTFAPGRLIIRDNTPYGYISGVVIPQFCDVDHDGKMDIMVLGRSSQEWWKWHYEEGNVVIDEIVPFRFTAEPIKTEAKTFWYDWDKDGLGDVIASQLGSLGKDEVTPSIYVYPNVGTAGEPLIDTANPVEIDIPKVDLQWQYIPTDWDCDGDTDFISAGFIHELYFYENTGTDANPQFPHAERIKTYDRREINIPQALINIVVVDWDGDGDKDLLYGCEDGVVGFMENIAGQGKKPQLRQPVYLNQTRPVVDGGSISVPHAVDWDCDGDKDLIIAASNTLQYYENLGTDTKPFWSHPRDMRAGGSKIQLRAGDEGSIQGIEELCWQYNNAETADWDGDGLKDLIVSGIRGEHVLFRNIGSKTAPRLQRGTLMEVDWKDEPLYPEWSTVIPQADELITVWRTRPEAIDYNGDGLTDYVTLDHTGELALYLRSKTPDGKLVLNEPQNIFTFETPYSQALVWNRAPNARAGMSGRTIVNLADWDGDGDYDLILDNVNARYYENVTDNERPLFKDRGDLVKERLANHNAGPSIVDWDNDGRPDLLIGTETGRVFYFNRAYIEGDEAIVRILE